MADTLQCNIWKRAQTPHRMTYCFHGGDNGSGKFNGFAAPGKSIGTPDSTEKDSAYVMEHPVLKYGRAKFANFLNEAARGTSFSWENETRTGSQALAASSSTSARGPCAGPLTTPRSQRHDGCALSLQSLHLAHLMHTLTVTL